MFLADKIWKLGVLSFHPKSLTVKDSPGISTGFRKYHKCPKAYKFSHHPCWTPSNYFALILKSMRRNFHFSKTLASKEKKKIRKEETEVHIAFLYACIYRVDCFQGDVGCI